MLRLFTLGDLRMETADGRVLSRRRKPLVLLAYLCRKSPQAVFRVELATLLWGQRNDARARQSLRQALLELKHILGDALETTHDHVGIAASVVELDITSFEREVDSGREEVAVSRWQGDFLAGAEDAGELALELWIATERAGLRRRLSLAFERLLSDATERGSWSVATMLASRWLDATPLDEHACASLIKSLQAENRPSDALAVHARFVVRIQEELGVQPSRPFLAMIHTVERSAAHEMTLAKSDRAESVLPMAGREAAFSALTSAWADSRQGKPVVVCIECERGMGSTRLANEFVHWVLRTERSAFVIRDKLAHVGMGEVSFAYARSLLGATHSSPSLGGLSQSSLAALSDFVPELKDRFPHIPEPDPAARSDPSAVLIEALDTVGEDCPLVIIADQYCDADDASRELIARVVTSMTAPALIVLTNRPGDAERIVALARLLESGSARRLSLSPLTTPDIAGILRVACNLAPGDAAQLARILRDDTVGIPRYVACLVNSLLASGLIVPGKTATDFARSVVDAADLPVPDETIVEATVRRRHLGELSQRALDISVVLGGDFSEETISAATGARGARDQINEIVDAGLLCALPGGRYTIQPPILARALYALIPPLHREELHSRCGAALRSRSRPWRRNEGERGQVRFHARRSGARFAAPSRVIRSPVVVGLTTVALATALAIGISFTRVAKPVKERVVTIFPFAVRGGAHLAFLENGMVDLLSTSLNGAAGLRTVDPRVVIAAVTASGRSNLDADMARKIAAQFGATYFVLGDVVADGSAVQVIASLYDMKGGTAPIAHVSANGNEATLFELVDDLTRQLAVAQGAAANERLTRLAAVTTKSLDALKAYLDGRDAYRRNDLLGALPAFERAVAADSSFALAWYGLATTASWMLRSGLERHAAAQAVLHDARLSDRDRTLIEAFAAYSRGSADTAEHLAGSIVESYDDDVEAWALLGEILYHHNWARGRSLAESRRAWERVLALDPSYWPALQHLSEVAAVEGRWGQVDSLLDRYESSVGAEHMPVTSLAFRAFTTGDGASRDVIAARVSTDRGFWLTLSIWYVAVNARDVEGARRLAHFLVDPVRSPEQQGFGRILLAHLDMAQGKWRDAKAELAIARAHTPTDALEYRLLLSMAPFLATPDSEIVRQNNELATLPLHADEAATIPWPYRFAGMHALIRPYMAGMVAARRGDNVSRLKSLATLSAIDDSMLLSRSFASAVRAEELRAHKHPAQALLELERGAHGAPFVRSWTSGFVSQAYERYQRAELLHELGRDDEALRWYGSFAENSPYDLVYVAPGLYREAQILESRGQRRQAAARYARFLELWKDSDAEFRPVTADARRHLAMLQ